jgi:HEAT repeat protein
MPTLSHRNGFQVVFIHHAALSFLILTFACNLTHAQERETASRLLQRFNNVAYFWEQPEIARQIIALRDPSVLIPLEPLLTDPDRHKRGNAALIFAGLGDKRGFEVIADILSDYSDRPEGQGGFTGFWAVRKQITEDRYYAVHLLGLLKDPRAVPIVVALLDDPDVNYSIPWALRQNRRTCRNSGIDWGAPE